MSQEQKQTKPETITLTAEALEAMMQRVAEKARAEMAPPPPPPPLPDPRFEGYTADQRMILEKMKTQPVAPPLQYVPCISRPENGGTGARWLAAVVPATTRNGKKVPDRVVDLLYYTKPDGWDQPISEANPFGLDPEACRARVNGQLPRRLKHAVYERFWQADLRANNGRPLNSVFRMTEEETAAAAFPIPNADKVA